MSNDYAHIEELEVILFNAYRAARKGKRKHTDEYEFEMNLYENIERLAIAILDRSYRLTGGISFVNFKPVIREIIAAEFKDRVVQHAAFSGVYGWWDTRLHPNSCSCRIGKGTDYAIDKVYSMMQSVSQNWQKEAYICKFDFKGYFMSINREKLRQSVINGLNRQFKDDHSWWPRTLKFLWETIIMDDPIKHVRKRGRLSDFNLVPYDKSLYHQAPGVGLPIGNVTSQMGSNIMLDPFDRFVAYELGYKHYVRYVDDWVVICTPEEKERLLQYDLPRIELFARSLGLTLHPNKRYIQEVKHGVHFLGAIIYPHHILPDYRLINNFRTTAQQFQMGCADQVQLQSYLGRNQRFAGANIERQIFHECGWDYPFGEDKLERAARRLPKAEKQDNPDFLTQGTLW